MRTTSEKNRAAGLRRGVAALATVCVMVAGVAGVAVANEQVAGASGAADASAAGESAVAAIHEAYRAEDGTLPDCGGCHDVEALAEATANWNGNTNMNPHNAHVPVSCGYCHTMEGAEQTMFCATCHDMALPDGWVGRERIGGNEQEK